jgi:homoserine O-acetyltransferase
VDRRRQGPGKWLISPFNGGGFPHVTIGDDVAAQHRLITEVYGIRHLQLVLGWSIGAEQTYEWAVRFADMVKRALPFAGTAKTTPHDFIFVRSREDALKSDPAWNNGYYAHQSDVHVGLRRHAQIWSVMGLCQDFYNKEAWREVGFTSLDDFMHRFWEAYFAPMDPNNLIWMGWNTAMSAGTPTATSRRRSGGSRRAHMSCRSRATCSSRRPIARRSRR